MNSKKKVLIVGPIEANGRYSGGINKILVALQNELQLFKNEGIEVFFQNTCLINRTNQKIGKFSISNICNAFLLRKNVKNQLKMQSIDILYWHSSCKIALLKDLIIIASLNCKNKTKIIHIHYSDINKILFNVPIIDNFILHILKHKINTVVVMSNGIKQEFVEIGINEKQVKSINNFYYFKESCSNQHFDKSDKIKFLFIGSLDRRKGIIDLMNALVESTTKERINIKIAGDYLEEDVRNEVESIVKNKLNNVDIKFLGYINDEEKSKVYNDSDCLILASYEEGLPLVILEALAKELDIITTPVGSISEILTNQNCQFFEPGDIYQLAHNIDNVVLDVKSSKNRRKTNKELSYKYNIELFIKKLSDVFKG